MSKALLKAVKEYQELTTHSNAAQSEMRKQLKDVLSKRRDVKKLIKQIESYGESSNDKGYQWTECGDIEFWMRVSIPDCDVIADKYGIQGSGEVRQALEDIIQDHACARLDFDNSCAMIFEGDSIIIQEEQREHDRGVWCGQNQVIKESEYINENGSVDVKKRNKLIEKYMEKTGYFPNVFRNTYHGTLHLVNTLERE